MHGGWYVGGCGGARGQKRYDKMLTQHALSQCKNGHAEAAFLTSVVPPG